jgi:hypothetical protein
MLRKIIFAVALAATLAGQALAGWPWYRPVHNKGDALDLDSSTITNGTLSPDMLAAVGPNISGNIPKAAITNALLTSGPQIGGNIPKAAITNALVDGTSGLITTAMILDSQIMNADLASNAAIAQSKLATNTIGAVTITLVDTGVSTNVLYFSAVGILTNWTHDP